LPSGTKLIDADGKEQREGGVMDKIEAAELELECAERSYAAMVEYRSKVAAQLEAANKAVNEASSRTIKARFELRVLKTVAAE
jgi:hypothetical protein